MSDVWRSDPGLAAPDLPFAAFKRERRAMVSFEEFEEIVYEITETLPEVFFRELDGGVMVREQRKIHPESVGDDLGILGEYHKNRYLGRYVVIYYGSFMAAFGYLDREDLKKRVRKTVLHEFRHHLESLAGERDLEIEDQKQLAAYKKSKKILDESGSSY